MIARALAEAFITVCGEAMIYCVLTAAAMVLAFGLAAFLLAPATLVSGTGPFYRRLSRLVLFLSVLFRVGFAADLVWVAMFPDRLYFDPDPLASFSPVLPFMLDQACGGHLLRGVSFTVMNGLWLVFAVVSWTASFRITRRLVYARAA